MKLYMRNWQNTFCFRNLDPNVLHVVQRVRRKVEKMMLG